MASLDSSTHQCWWVSVSNDRSCLGVGGWAQIC